MDLPGLSPIASPVSPLPEQAADAHSWRLAERSGSMTDVQLVRLMIDCERFSRRSARWLQLGEGHAPSQHAWAERQVKFEGASLCI